jgi:hypothetical protein
MSDHVQKTGAVGAGHDFLRVAEFLRERRGELEVAAEADFFLDGYDWLAHSRLEAVIVVDDAGRNS